MRSVPKELHQQAGVLVGEILRAMHGVKVDGFGWPLPKGGWGVTSWLDALHQNYFDSSMEKKHEVFADEEIKQVEQITFFNEKLNIVEPRLIHSDVGHGNSLYKITDHQLSLVGFIDPNGIIGGDPMFDVSLDTETDDFNKGVWEGYTKKNALSPEEEYRLGHLGLLKSYWSTCWHYATGRDYKPEKEKTIKLLGDLIVAN